MSLPEPTSFARLEHLARIWRDRVDGPLRKASLAVSVGSIFVLSHLARLGTTAARTATAVALSALFVSIAIRSLVRRRTFRDPRQVVARLLSPVDPELGGRALRAMKLVERASADPAVGSQELARVHLDRTLGRARPDDVGERAARVAASLQKVALGAGLLALGAVSIGPFRVVEGLDVLAARRGVAPFAFRWLDEPGLIAHPPDYLHEQDVAPDSLARSELPYGSLLTVRGVPMHAGRRLVLVDGTSEVPFVDDAAGGVVARWPLGKSTRLRIAARFGGVIIPEPYEMEITSIPDEAPVVEVEGAPKTVKLLDAPEIAIAYEVNDDHGLREVHLVLRSGTNEERRMLARLDGETKHDRGGYRLLASDRFFKRSFAPVEITVEARDNDPLRGPKWGKSAAITVVPPLVGEPEALRYQALAGARDAIIDLAAFRIENDLDGTRLGRDELRAHAVKEEEETGRAAGTVEQALDQKYGGLSASRAIKTSARGRLRKIREGLAGEMKKVSAASHGKNRALAEDFAMTLDGVLRLLDSSDTVTIAKRLADVADDAAEGVAEARRPSERDKGVVRFQAGQEVLQGGGEQLSRLGARGHDIGEIVANDLKRARRAEGTEDLLHAELALRDLAARLRHPSPSFGGGGRRGGAGWKRGPGAEPSDVGQQIAREQQELEDLAKDHAAEMAGVERAMKEAESGQELDQLREEARKHAQAVRDAVRSLPRSAGEPSSAEAAASAAREHAEAMADELERGGVADAVKSGKSAAGALEQAERAPVDRFGRRRNTREDAREAAKALDPEVRWAEQALDRLRQAAAGRAGEGLRKTAPREGKLAERARSLADEGSNGAGALPDSTLDLLREAESAMRDAARALGGAQGERGFERQKEAQRLLEMARSGDDGDEGSSSEQPSESERGKDDKNEGGSQDYAHRAPIPKAEDYKGPEAFRQRVLEGLGGATDPRLREAVKRYAEGLLR